MHRVALLKLPEHHHSDRLAKHLLDLYRAQGRLEGGGSNAGVGWRRQATMDTAVATAGIVGAITGVVALIVALLTYFKVDPASPRLRAWTIIGLAILVTGSSAFAIGRYSADNSKTDRESVVTTAEQATEILSPEPDDRIPFKISVKGRASGVQPGQVVWIVDRENNGDAYYPHDFPCPIEPDGTWECDNIYIGVQEDSKRDEPKRYEILAVIADGNAQKSLIQYHYTAVRLKDYRGVQGHPEGVYVPPAGSKGRVTVSRDIEQ
jgi:hypothetical protein